jgi:hypothetical protein
MGRAFGLRDRGQLEEALDVCREALRLLGPTDPGRQSVSSFGTIVVGALTMDEIGRRLGRPQIAREPLQNALLLLEAANRDPRRPSDELIRREREVRARLEELPPVG